MSAGRRLVAALLGRTATTLTRAALEESAPGGQERWLRTNHRGEPVSMLEGPAVAAGVLAGAVTCAPDARAAAALALATGAGAAFGIVDDLGEDLEDRRKGLRGHLGALAHGKVTTGGLKVLGIGAGAVLAAAVATPVTHPDGRRRGAVGWSADVLASGALIAASANLVNLLDLRPGRALKATVLVTAPLALLPGRGGVAASAVVGAASAAADQDLAETDMLGDGGANALGAALGTALVLSGSRAVRLAALAAAVGLTVASEKVSFTSVIEATPVLRDIDRWGRRPVHTPVRPPATDG
ncbi:hypothetical protein [Cellulomonas sp.]|uniref:hypothetical protein n=1 Tax=Cellulomonas sp. TaxID=40001 RepID=UPI00258EB887|nr:hypothetical protein [Cellulomonas sp.]MCR6689801.1 hypothetical protein [Cellulomonas sp.]